MPSPYNKQAPNMPIAIRPNHRPSLSGLVRFRRAVKARTPPSPLLSARRTKARYLMVTIIMRDQTSETERQEHFHWTRRYHTHHESIHGGHRAGLVPMSPKTIPKAASVTFGRWVLLVLWCFHPLRLIRGGFLVVERNTHCLPS